MLDSRAVADMLGTTPKILRQFLRSPQSTFQAVGSNARYEFTTNDLPTLRKRFAEWAAKRSTPATVKPTKSNVAQAQRDEAVTKRTQAERDRAVWDEEGPVVLPDIRNPAVLQAVRDTARAQEMRLDELLMAAGLHITQWRDR